MKEKMIKGCCQDKSRLNKVGGQAVLEGVMMKAGNRTVTTCRKESGELVVTDGEFVSVRKKHKILNIPILRGIINFVEMMILSVKTLYISADSLGLEDEESKGEKWLKKHLGVGITEVVMVIGVVLGVALALGLFMFLPNFIARDLIDRFIFDGKLGVWTAVLEGVVKIGIFLLYLWLCSLLPDIRRTFMYHGAEHKSIACFESGEELTPENARKYTRLHPRCGTSFMFFMILLGIFAGLFIKLLFENVFELQLDTWAYTAIRLLILPIVVGLGYEVIMLAGKHDNFLTRAISAPGKWVQKITTKEPTPDMLEVAITSIKCALRDDFPEFREFYESRAWQSRADGDGAGCESVEAESSEPESGSESAE